MSAARNVSSVPTHRSRTSRMVRSDCGYGGGSAELGEMPEFTPRLVLVISLTWDLVEGREQSGFLVSGVKLRKMARGGSSCGLKGTKKSSSEIEGNKDLDEIIRIK